MRKIHLLKHEALLVSAQLTVRFGLPPVRLVGVRERINRTPLLCVHLRSL